MIELLEWGKMKRGPKPGSITVYLQRKGESEPYGAARRARQEKIEKMAAMYREGKTLQEIGDVWGVTRERARQLLRKGGIDPITGGRALKGYFNRKEAAAKNKSERDSRYFEKYGCDFQAWKAIGAKNRARFYMQRNSARHRGIEWNLLLADWWAIWAESGKFDQRGRGKGYCMARIADCGPYSKDNVEIIAATENGRQALEKHDRAAYGQRGGVYYMYPGLAKPWVAKFGKKTIGMFATEAEAREARKPFSDAAEAKKQKIDRHRREFLELRKKGVKVKDIVKMYGVSESYVQNRIYY